MNIGIYVNTLLELLRNFNFARASAENAFCETYGVSQEVYSSTAMRKRGIVYGPLVRVRRVRFGEKCLLLLMNEPRRKQRGIVRSPEELHSEFNTFLTAPRGGVSNLSARINANLHIVAALRLDVIIYRNNNSAFVWRDRCLSLRAEL